MTTKHIILTLVVLPSAVQTEEANCPATGNRQTQIDTGPDRCRTSPPKGLVRASNSFVFTRR